MEIRFTYGRNLWDQHELNLIHPALGGPFEIVAEDRSRLSRKAEEAIAICLKRMLSKYLSVVTYARGAYLDAESKGYLAELKELKRYFARNMRLVTIQKALQEQLFKIEALLPRRKSRNYRSQIQKYQFFQAVTAFKLEQVDHLISSTV